MVRVPSIGFQVPHSFQVSAFRYQPSGIRLPDEKWAVAFESLAIESNGKKPKRKF
jgi:hypothetical protein